MIKNTSVFFLIHILIFRGIIFKTAVPRFLKIDARYFNFFKDEFPRQRKLQNS